MEYEPKSSGSTLSRAYHYHPANPFRWQSVQQSDFLYIGRLVILRLLRPEQFAIVVAQGHHLGPPSHNPLGAVRQWQCTLR